MSTPTQKVGGGERVRTDDLLLAKQVLSQLSYAPEKMVGLGRLELPTSRLSGVRSNRLSYGPISLVLFIRAPNNSKKGFIDDDIMSINNLIQINEIKLSLERR